MGSRLKTFYLLLLLPFLLVIGHDVYANYFSDVMKQKKLENLRVDPNSFQFSDAGYLWVTYFPDNYINARKSMSGDTWETYIDPVLETPSAIVAILPAAFIYALLMAAWALGIWPFNHRRPIPSQKLEYDMYGKPINKPMKYTRK